LFEIFYCPFLAINYQVNVMSQRLLQLDDVRNINNPDNVVGLFKKLGYKTFENAQSLPVKDLELPARSEEAIEESYLIADHSKGPDSLQVLLFQLSQEEWKTPGLASNRMRLIAQGLSRRPSNFLLLGTRNFNQIMLVNPRKSLDAQMNFRVGIRKLLIDRTKPTHYDRDRLEAIAARDFEPQALYQAQCTAFDVEKLTKEFYQGYQELFKQVQRTIFEHNPHPYFDDETRLHQFSQRLLGRVMFLYFLQKKEFLAGKPDFLSSEFKKHKDLGSAGFYNQVLEPLFFEILNCERPDSQSPWGKIPYLNGGLFERDYGGFPDATGRETPKEIWLPNSLFNTKDNGVLNFFDSYNFTVSEDIEGDETIGVSPEMLGKILENMLAADERGQSGTFYTPRGVVQFMCVESLSRYLADETGMDLDVVRQLTEFDPALHEERINELLTKEQAKKIKKALASVKVCDPSVGSGAYPIGMMQVIVAVKQAIACREEGRAVKRGSLRISEWKREIIANNLYGVDIKPEAIEIAKLRMWLSMVVDIPEIEDVEPLPNLDYKLMAGNSLISTICGERIIPDVTKDNQLALVVNPVQGEIQRLADLQQQYFNSSSDERKALSAEILAAEKQVFRLAIDDRRKFWKSEQRRLETNAARLKGKVSRAAAKEQATAELKLRELDRMGSDVERGLKSLDFFQWQLHFHDVFQEKGGFDIVIGNPPYVRQEEIKELKPALQSEYDCYTGTADLFVYFYERAFQLLRSGGNLTYITSNKYMRSGYGEKLRQFLSSQGTIQHLIDFGDAPVFEAIAYPSIMLVTKATPKNHNITALTWNAEKSINSLSAEFRSSSFTIEQKELTADGWGLESPVTLRLLEKLRAAGQPLGEYIDGRFYYGIKTGFNEAFVVDRATRNRLIAEHPSSAEVLEPFLRGRDVKRWHTDFADQYLIKIESSENKLHPWSKASGKEAEKIFSKRYPAIHAWLGKSRDALIKRCDQGRFFWELRSCQYWADFNQPKIIYPDIYEHQSFMLDVNQYYAGNTCYFIPTDEYWLCGLLNSSVVEWFYSQISNKVRGGYLRAFTSYIKQIPIPETSASEQKAISALVKKCLEAKGHGVEFWEAEINDRVARLYGLTADEIELIAKN
jgi:adenine-specific DNA-methyltransferase